MVFKMLPIFVTDRLSFLQQNGKWPSSRSPDVFLTEGGVMDSRIWNNLERRNSATANFQDSKSFASIRRQTFAVTKNTSVINNLNGKFTKGSSLDSSNVLDNNHKERKRWVNHRTKYA